MADRASSTLPAVAHPLSYLLCGTPRTGSTLLCGLLTSTGVAGRPESYFREPDEPAWAYRLGVPMAGDGSFDYRMFVRAAVSAGSTPNGVFAARVMWGTMHRIVDGLDPFRRNRGELEVLIDGFGQLLLVHCGETMSSAKRCRGLALTRRATGRKATGHRPNPAWIFTRSTSWCGRSRSTTRRGAPGSSSKASSPTS